MNGATAEPCVSTISADSRTMVIRIGPSHHFFRTRMKAQSSRRIDIIAGFSRWRRESIQGVAFAPIEVLDQLGLVFLPEDLVAEHQDVHLGSHEAEVG